MEYFTSLVQFSLEFSRMGLWLKGFLHDCPTAVALSSPPLCTYIQTQIYTVDSVKNMCMYALARGILQQGKITMVHCIFYTY